MPMKDTFGPWLREQLREMGMTQMELAQRISIQPSQISRIISGERGTSIEVLEAIARAIRVPVETVFREAVGLNSPEGDLSPTKRQLLDMAEQVDDETAEIVLDVLRATWERKKRQLPASGQRKNA